jgi:hypothetical protein
MLALLTVLNIGYFAVLFWVLRTRRRNAVTEVLPALPDEDLPPASAVGWPPEGASFATYVEEGLAALDAYLEEGFAP